MILTLLSALGVGAITHESEGEDNARRPGKPRSSKFEARTDPVAWSVRVKKSTQSEPDVEQPNLER